MIRHSILALVLLVFSGALARAQDLAGQRTISGLTIDYTVSSAVAQIDVKLSLNGEFVDGAVLTYAAPTHNFSVAANGMSARGAIGMSVMQGPDPSSLAGDFTVVDAGGKAAKFQGDVVEWAAPDDLQLFSQSYNLMANLSVRTTVLNGARYGAQVDYMTGSTLLYTSYLLPASNISTTPFDIVIGDIKLNMGAKLMLTPPSNLSNGAVVLDCTFSSESIPPTRFTGVIASWPLQSGGATQLIDVIAGGPQDVGRTRASLRIQPLSGRRRRSGRMVRVHAPARRPQPRRLDLAL